jgi:hypothetical protein
MMRAGHRRLPSKISVDENEAVNMKKGQVKGLNGGAAQG